MQRQYLSLHGHPDMNPCVFLAVTAGSPCHNCGYRLKHDYTKPPRRNCSASKPRLGGVTKRLLEKGSITPELVAKIVRIITLGAKQPDAKQGCGGCNKRQQWLNRWPAPRWLAALAGFKKVEN